MSILLAAAGLAVLASNAAALPELPEPTATRGAAMVFERASPQRPLQLIEFEVGGDFARIEQHVPNGSFGWALRQFCIMREESGLHFYPLNNRAEITQGFAAFGLSPAEAWVSPAGWFREARRPDAGMIVSQGPDGVEYAFTLRNGDRVTITGADSLPSPTADTVMVVRVRGSGESTYRYSEWKELANGSVYPSRIDTVLTNAALTVEMLTSVTSCEPIAAGAGPSGYELPPQTIVLDRARGLQLDSELNPTGPINPALASPPRAGRSSVAGFAPAWWTWSVALGGVLVIVSALWRRAAARQA